MSEPLTPEAQRGYAKGYAAGSKRLKRENEAAIYAAKKEEFRRAVFLAILPELVRAPWQTGEKAWSSMPEFTKGAWNFADQAVKGTHFTTAGDAN